MNSREKAQKTQKGREADENAISLSDAPPSLFASLVPLRGHAFSSLARAC